MISLKPLWVTLMKFSLRKKKLGYPICQRRVRAIHDCMNEWQMLDLDFLDLNLLGPTRGIWGVLSNVDLIECGPILTGKPLSLK